MRYAIRNGNLVVSDPWRLLKIEHNHDSEREESPLITGVISQFSSA